jgi:formate dehydrogenase major subunit
VLYQDGFPQGERAMLARIDWRPDPEQCDEHYPLLLSTGRDLYAFNTSTMTGRTPNRALHPCDMLTMAAEDAARLRLRDGQRVRVLSRYGSVILPLRCMSSLRPGEVFATFHHPEVLVNQIISPYRDELVHTPAYKRTAVRVEPAGDTR